MAFQNVYGFRHCHTNVEVMPMAVFRPAQTFIFRPHLHMEENSSIQNAEIERFCTFCHLTMSDLNDRCLVRFF